MVRRTGGRMTGQFELPISRARVLVTDNLSPKGVDLLLGSPGIEVDVRNSMSPEALKERLQAADALIVRSATRVTATSWRARRGSRRWAEPASAWTTSTSRPPRPGAWW